MIRALYTAASGMLFGLRQQDIAAENLANSQTSGFKAETSAGAAFSGILALRMGNEQAPIPLRTDEVLGGVGTGVYQQMRGNDFSEGADTTTDEPLDLAIAGNGFFVVQSPSGGVQYTRDGHFGRDPQNQLVTSQGLPVLGVDGNPIVLTSDQVQIKPSGDVIQNGQTVGTLQVMDIDPATAIRAGATAFEAGPGTTPTAVQLGSAVTIQQGMLEQANVDAAQVASQLLATSQTFDANQHVFTTINDTLDRAANQVGKVA